MSFSCLSFFYYIHQLSIKFENSVCTMPFTTNHTLTSTFICNYYPVPSYSCAFVCAVHFACTVLFPLLFLTLPNLSFNTHLMCHLFREVFPGNPYTSPLFVTVCSLQTMNGYIFHLHCTKFSAQLY